jgi:Ca2+-binding EF-hand superfamily protein
MEVLGEKLTDEEAEEMIKESDLDLINKTKRKEEQKKSKLSIRIQVCLRT